MSDVEKHSTSHDSQDGINVAHVEGLPPDPDSHLSREEKAKIVSIVPVARNAATSMVTSDSSS